MRFYKFIFILSTLYFLLSTVVYIFAQEEYTAQNLRDPFSSAIPEEPEKKPIIEEISISEEPISLPRLNIQALVWGTSLPQAIINGKVLKIGDTIEGAKIVGISKDGIDLIYEGRLFVLPSPAEESLKEKKEEP